MSWYLPIWEGASLPQLLQRPLAAELGGSVHQTGGLYQPKMGAVPTKVVAVWGERWGLSCPNLLRPPVPQPTKMIHLTTY
jgi:hypothetical protein